MGKSSKKRKAKTADFQKTKIKVGKERAPPSNATDTSFTSKGLTVLGQFHHINETDDGSEKPVKLLFTNLRNSSRTVRQSAINSLKEAALNSATQAARYLDGAVKYLPQILSDDDAEVRKSALELSAILFTGCSSTQLAPFLSSLGACCSLVLSHINWLVKLDGLKFCSMVFQNLQDGVNFVDFYTNLTGDVIRLLKSNTRPKIRDSVFEILLVMVKKHKHRLPTNTQGYNERLLMRMPNCEQVKVALNETDWTSHLNALILPAADAIIQETFAPNTTITAQTRNSFENATKIVSIMVGKKHKLHKWITSRMVSHFPLDNNSTAELEIVIINLRMAKLYAKSYSATYNSTSKVLDEPVVRQRVEEYIIRVFTEQGRPRGVEGMELAVKTVISVKAIGLDLFKHVVDYLNRTRFSDRKKLGVLSAVFNYLEKNSDESSEVLVEFAVDNITSILAELLAEIPNQSSNRFSLDVLRSAFRCCNIIAKTYLFRCEEKKWNFYQQLSQVLEDSLANLSLLSSSFTQDIFSVFFILPPNWLHPLLRNTEDLLVYLWQEEMFDCGFMEKFIFHMPPEIDHLRFVMQVLFRNPPGTAAHREEMFYKEVEGLHEEIYYLLISADRQNFVREVLNFQVLDCTFDDFDVQYMSTWLTLARAVIRMGLEEECDCIVQVAAEIILRYENVRGVSNFVEKYLRFDAILPYLATFPSYASLSAEADDVKDMAMWCDYVSRLVRKREICDRKCVKQLLCILERQKEFEGVMFWQVTKRELEIIISQQETKEDE